MATAGWYRDPSGQGDGRYWDGQRWGDEANSSGATLSSPMDPDEAETPPAPGSEYVAPPPTATQTTAAQPARKSPVGAILGGVAVIIAVIVLVVVLVNNNDDGDTEEEPPAVTLDGELPDAEQPESTEAPAEGE